jgi:hypothetical protein
MYKYVTKQTRELGRGGGEGNKGAIGGHALIKGNTDRQYDEHTSSVVQNSFGYLEFS